MIGHPLGFQVLELNASLIVVLDLRHLGIAGGYELII